MFMFVSCLVVPVERGLGTVGSSRIVSVFKLMYGGVALGCGSH